MPNWARCRVRRPTWACNSWSCIPIQITIFEAAFPTLIEQKPEALLVCASPLFNSTRDQLVALAARHNIPAAFELREYATAGGLLSYGNSITDVYRQLGVYFGCILAGATPADLPVIRPTKFELVFNVKTARTIRINIS